MIGNQYNGLVDDDVPHWNPNGLTRCTLGDMAAILNNDFQIYYTE